MPTLYLDPTGNGTTSASWSGDYTDVDDGTRAPNTPGTDEMYSSSQGAVQGVTFSVGGNTGTASSITAWTWNDTGVPAYELFIDTGGGPSSLGQKTSADTSNGSWSGWTWGYSGLIENITSIELQAECSTDEDDSIEAIYLAVEYTGGSSSPAPAVAVITLCDIVQPPMAGFNH